MTSHRSRLLTAGALERVRARVHEGTDVERLRESELFDADDYLARHPDVAASGMEPHRHFVRFGAREGRSAGPRFDADDYSARYPDVATSGMHPLLHYLRHGRAEGRRVQPVGGTDPGTPPRPGPVPSPPRPSRPTGSRALRLGAPVASLEAGKLTITCDMGDAPSLWVTIEGPADALARIEPRAEPFVPIALLMAGVARRDLVVEGPLDPDFLVALQVSYVPLLGIMFDFPRTAIEVETSRGQGASPSRAHDPAGAALLFSGGIDSFYSLTRLRQIGYPLRYLMNVNAGGSGRYRDLAQLRQARIGRLARAAGYELLTVDTDFHEVVDISHLHAHPFRTVPAAYTAHGAVSGLFLANAVAYKDLSFKWKDQGSGVSGTTVTDSVAWARMPVTEIGYDKTRFEKLRAITDEPLSYDALDICLGTDYLATAGVEDVTNCGSCHKCARAMLALEHMGCLDRYASQFDIERFIAQREDRLNLIVERREHVHDGALLAYLRGTHVEDSGPVTVRRPRWVESLDSADPTDAGAPSQAAPDPIRLSWSRNEDPELRHAGDELGPLIVGRLSGRPVEWTPPEACELMAAGSISDVTLGAERDTPLPVWGSGFDTDGELVERGSVQACALRGPESARRLGLEGQVPLGDPLLLTDLLLNGRPAKLQRLGIIPDVEHLESPVIETWRTEPGVIISPRLPPMIFIAAIARCEFVLASSLPGLIVADALGVPNRWVRLPDEVAGDSFEFRDYLEAVGRSTEPIGLPTPEAIDEEAMHALANDDAPVGIDRMREDLLRAFPLG